MSLLFLSKNYTQYGTKSYHQTGAKIIIKMRQKVLKDGMHDSTNV